MQTQEKTKNAGEIIGFLHSLQLFSALGADEITAFLASGDIYLSAYEAGDIIYNKNVLSCDVHPGIVMKGEAAVYSADDERDVCLRLLGIGGFFGAVNMFSVAEKFISTVKAEKKCTVLFISSAAFRKLLESNKEFMYSYLAFLGERISFLNRKIRQFTAGSTERRVAVFLDTLSENDEFTLPFSYSKLYEMLDIGRASLYRALDALTESKIIIRDGKRITVLDRTALREYAVGSCGRS